MAASGLRFAPGSEWQYGAGHDVLARLIEVFTGETYEEFLAANVRQLVDCIFIATTCTV
jgi:CubicO group peptidase (beta-lactamase class C family)